MGLICRFPLPDADQATQRGKVYCHVLRNDLDPASQLGNLGVRSRYCCETAVSTPTFGRQAAHGACNQLGLSHSSPVWRAWRVAIPIILILIFMAGRTL